MVVQITHRFEDTKVFIADVLDVDMVTNTTNGPITIVKYAYISDGVPVSSWIQCIKGQWYDATCASAEDMMKRPISAVFRRTD